MTERTCTRCKKVYDMEQGGTEKRCPKCRAYANEKQNIYKKAQRTFKIKQKKVFAELEAYAKGEI